jgi:hypothetical protein
MESMTTTKSMRDPAGNSDAYARFFASAQRLEQARNETFPTAPLDVKVSYSYSDFRASEELVLHRYGAGDPIDALKEEVLSQVEAMVASAEFLRTQGGEDWQGYRPVNGIKRDSTSFTGLAILLLDKPEQLASFRQLLSSDVEDRSYFMDILLKAFIPDYPLARKYKSDKYSAVWIEPILRALAGRADTRAAAFAAHMKNWCRIMRPWGWKPDLDTSPGKDKLFCDFAFEVAMAVCAYDIDDSTFNDHPYYPRDLVEHYRAEVRHTRDAWRPEGVGAGMPVLVPPLPKKADLAKSKRKGIARWVELVCDGNVDATEAVLETIGKPRKLDDIDELMEALGEASQAIHADIKDDETTLIQAGRLAEARGLGEFEGPAGPPFGPARCSAGLLAFAGWLQGRGYRLVDLDNQDDAWHAVVVRAEYHGELLELSDNLKIVAREPSAAYND